MQKTNLTIKPIVSSKGDIVGALIKSELNKSCYAKHYTYQEVDECGNSTVRQINTDIYPEIERAFDEQGDTECFIIKKTTKSSTRLDPKDIRHVLTKGEHTYTSTGKKLDFHWPIFKKLAETNYSSIIRATMTLHQRCSSKCPYCSTISRNASDCITLEEAKVFIDALYTDQAEFNAKHFPVYNNLYKEMCGSDIRLRGLILSGGGQPNLWPHFSEFVDWLSHKNISLGLITNGFPTNVPEDIYRHFDWIRISITPEDASPHYKDGRFDRQYLPASIINNPSITVGYSYVYGAWTDGEIFDRITNSIAANGFNYCRVLTDCNLSRNAQLESHKLLAEGLYSRGYIDHQGNPLGTLFHQLKYHADVNEVNEIWAEGQCYLQSYNTFWDTTGHDKNGYSYCYPCDSVTVLTSAEDDQIIPSARRFESDVYGTYKNTEVRRLYEEPLAQFFDPKDVCKGCLFAKNNLRAKELMRKSIDKDYVYNSDLSASLEHVNFP